jgi:uncharacterized protein YndB with AHSA1/START domain
MSESPATEGTRGFTLTRVFDAPRQLVWEAFTKPEHFTHWFGGSETAVPLDTLAMDVRPGGEWSAVMHTPDGRELPFAGVYREVVEPERLVFTYDNTDDRSDPKVEVATVTFKDLGGKTEVVFNQTGHLPEDVYPRTEHGTSTSFDALAERLAEIQAA